MSNHADNSVLSRCSFTNENRLSLQIMDTTMEPKCTLRDILVDAAENLAFARKPSFFKRVLVLVRKKTLFEEANFPLFLNNKILTIFSAKKKALSHI